MARRIISRIISSPAGEHCSNRAVEWLCSFMFVGMGATLIASPDTIARGAFRHALTLGMEPTWFGISLLGVAASRIVALIFNGRQLPWSARLRALCALYGVGVFALLTLSLAFLALETGTLALGVSVYFALSLAEVFSCLRAGADSHNYEFYRSVTATVVVHLEDNGNEGVPADVDARPDAV